MAMNGMSCGWLDDRVKATLDAMPVDIMAFDVERRLLYATMTPENMRTVLVLRR
jgi:hypothetical protein